MSKVYDTSHTEYLMQQCSNNKPYLFAVEKGRPVPLYVSFEVGLFRQDETPAAKVRSDGKLCGNYGASIIGVREHPS